MAYIPLIDTARIAADAVTSAKILDGEIVNADVASGAAIAYSKLDLSGSIVSGDIVDGTIVNADISGSAAIDLSKLATDPLARANHTGTQLASTISDFDTQVQTNRLDEMATPTADVSMGSQKITSLADGTAASDAATFGQVTAAVSALQRKAAVDLKTTVGDGDLDLTGEETIDGTLTSASLVLVTEQTDPAENGAYLTGAGAWTRVADMDTAAEVDSGASVWVRGGATHEDQLWTQVEDVVTLGTDALSFVQTGAAVTTSVISDNTDVTDSARVDGSLFRFEATGAQWEATTGSNLLLSDAGQLQVPTDGASAGIAIGSDGQIYRSAADELTTPDALVVEGALTTNARVREISSVKVANYTVADGDDLIRGDVSGGTFAVSLDGTVMVAGQEVEVKDVEGSASVAVPLTVDTTNAELIDGAASIAIDEGYMALRFLFDGTNFIVL